MADERHRSSVVQSGPTPATSVPLFDLLIISDGRPNLLRRLERALSGATPGQVAVLLREPALRTAALVDLGHAVRELTDRVGALLLVSDRIDVAQAIDADGVQVPEAGFAPEVARELLGHHAIIGASRHDRMGLMAAGTRGADYATLSPVRAVEGKGKALGVAGFAAKISGISLPVYALGGVTLQDVDPLLAAGARGVAVIREVLDAPDPEERVASLLARLAQR